MEKRSVLDIGAVINERAVERGGIERKGARDYLHGTDIFNALVDLTGARENLSLRLRRVMRHGIEAAPIRDAGTDLKEFAGLFLYGRPDTLRQIGLRENPAIEVKGRVPYAESEVTADAKLRAEVIVSPGPSRYTFIERVIALNKVLLLESVSTPKVRWWLTRLDLTRVPSPATMLSLGLAERCGMRLIKSWITADGEDVGYIYFSGTR